MDEDFRWPKKGDDPFFIETIDPNSPTWTSLQWLASLNVDDSFFGLAFKEAGDKIIKELSRGEDWKNPDRLFLPIAYLYRHGIELKLKNLIRIGMELDLIESDDKVLLKELESHKLHQLWNYVRIIVEKFWPEGPKEDINAAGRIIQEFHNIDKSGQNLRYSIDKSGNKTSEHLPKFVQLTHLQDVINAVFNFLDGCEAGLDHELETRNEMRDYYSDNDNYY
jgi:hypothetical protein